MQRNVFIILFTLVLFFSASSFVHAADFEQNYGDCDTDYHTVSSGTYSFTVNGIFAHKYTEWWVYDGSWDYKETDESWWGNGYYDPVFSHYFGSGTIYVDADVYDGDYNFECTYRWVITVSTPQSSTTTIGYSSSSTTTIGYSSSSTTTIGYSSSSSSTTTIGNSSSTTTIIPIENYIGTDENNPDVPDYGNFNRSTICSSGGICTATAAAAVLGYWDTHSYEGKIYWNIVDNGSAPLTQARNANGPDVDLLVDWLEQEIYCNNGGANGWVAGSIEDVCNTSGYENELNFNVNADLFFPSYSDLKTEVNDQKPLMIFLDSKTGDSGHTLPVWGYREQNGVQWVRVMNNAGAIGYAWIDWDAVQGDWTDYERDGLWRITPGGGSDDPHDHYDDDDSYSTANWLDPDATHNFLQTHNFHDSGDNDWIKFNAVSGRRYTIETKNLGTQCDTVIYLYNRDGTTEITHNDDGGSGVASKIIWDCISPYTSGTYFVKIEEFHSRGGPTTNFDIEIDWDYSPTSSSTTTIAYSSSSTTTVGYSSSSTTTIGYSSSSTTTTAPVSSTTTYQSSSTTTGGSTTTINYSSSSTTTVQPVSSTTTFQSTSTIPGTTALSFSNSRVDDDSSGNSSGNNNGIIDPGETIELYVTLKNTGSADAIGVTAELSTSDPYVGAFLFNTSSSYPDIPDGGTGENTNDFDFPVDPSCPLGHVITFDLAITSNEGSWTDSFKIVVGRSPAIMPWLQLLLLGD